MPNLNTKIAVPLIALSLVLLTGVSIAALNASRNVDFNGTIATVNVEVYSNQACTQLCSTINVGSLSPDDTFTQTVYVKNTGSVPVTLTMTANNWNPAIANNYLTFSWNRQNYVLNGGSYIAATLTLTSASNADSLTTFGFTATITGTQIET